MSFDAMTWAIRQRIETRSRLLLVALADRANKDGLAWPSVEWLAEFCGFHRTSIMRELVRLQLIEDSGGRRGRTSQVKVWKLRHAEDSLPLVDQRGKRLGSRAGKSRSIGDTLNGAGSVAHKATLFNGAKGSPLGKGCAPATGRNLSQKGSRSGDTEPSKEPVTKADSEKSVLRKVALASDWQPPTLPKTNRARQFVERWSPAELATQVERFRQRAKRDGVVANLETAWASHVWRVELGG